MRVVLLFVCLLPLAAAQPTAPARAPRQFTDEPARLQPPTGVRFLPDIQYREGDRVWRLDIALPATASPDVAPLPTLLNVHGGGWSAGDKDGGRNLICHWAQRGYVGVTIRYRLLHEAPFPACIQDVKTAVRFLRAHATAYRIDPNRIGAYGHSAGAHLVAMLGLCPPDAGLDTGPWAKHSSAVNAVVGIATPTDLAGNARELRRFPGANDDERRALARTCSPITYARADAPPFLLIQGTTDGIVPTEQATRFAAALREAGAKQVNLFLYDGRGHDPLPTHEAILRPMIDAFFDTTIGPRAGQLQAADDLGTKWRLSRQPGNPPFTFDDLKPFDRDGDGRISRAEFPSGDELFSRLDQDETSHLEPHDLANWRPRGTAASPAPR